MLNRYIKYFASVLFLVVEIKSPLIANKTTTVKVDGQIFKLTAPQGFCFLSGRLDCKIIDHELSRAPT